MNTYYADDNLANRWDTLQHVIVFINIQLTGELHVYGKVVSEYNC